MPLICVRYFVSPTVARSERWKLCFCLQLQTQRSNADCATFTSIPASSAAENMAVVLRRLVLVNNNIANSPEQLVPFTTKVLFHLFVYVGVLVIAYASQRRRTCADALRHTLMPQPIVGVHTTNNGVGVNSGRWLRRWLVRPKRGSADSCAVARTRFHHQEHVHQPLEQLMRNFFNGIQACISEWRTERRSKADVPNAR